MFTTGRLVGAFYGHFAGERYNRYVRTELNAELLLL